ncbi:hypothetical protein HMPREF1404_01115 [Helicobacter pylori GAM210Bi]|nr:hypothetical protein HMPREF1404_01115 [Helicobacter pylori GAM210Bi]
MGGGLFFEPFVLNFLCFELLVFKPFVFWGVFFKGVSFLNPLF